MIPVVVAFSVRSITAGRQLGCINTCTVVAHLKQTFFGYQRLKDGLSKHETWADVVCLIIFLFVMEHVYSMKIV